MTINLYWKSQAGLQSLVEKPFSSENELERFIFANQEILGGDISIIYRQIKTGSKQGIPDMLGVDQDGRICIVELKNTEADEGILPQALGYAIWAETNPDSIKAIWLESEHKPDETQLEWDNLDIRVILIAPSFKSSVLSMSGKIGYQLDLITIRRYIHEDNEFLLINNLDPTAQTKVKTTKVSRDWTWEYYESEHGTQATSQFKKMVKSIEDFAARRGWNLPYNLNKHYTGFKLGNRVVFNVAWEGSKAWKVKLKLPEKVGWDLKGQSWEFQSYDSAFREAIFRPLNPDNPSVEELESLLLAAYEYVSGRK